MQQAATARPLPGTWDDSLPLIVRRVREGQSVIAWRAADRHAGWLGELESVVGLGPLAGWSIHARVEPVFRATGRYTAEVRASLQDGHDWNTRPWIHFRVGRRAIPPHFEDDETARRAIQHLVWGRGLGSYQFRAIPPADSLSSPTSPTWRPLNHVGTLIAEATL